MRPLSRHEEAGLSAQSGRVSISLMVDSGLGEQVRLSSARLIWLCWSKADPEG